MIRLNEMSKKSPVSTEIVDIGVIASLAVAGVSQSLPQILAFFLKLGKIKSKFKVSRLLVKHHLYLIVFFQSQ